MKRYGLKTKTGEVINVTKAIDKENAIDFFAIIKKMSKKDLLNIFLVDSL